MDLKKNHIPHSPQVANSRWSWQTFGPSAHLLLQLRRRGDATFAHRHEEDHAPTLLCLGQHQLFCRQHRNTLTADGTSCSYYGQHKSQGSFYLFILIIGKLGPPSVGMCDCGVRAAVRVCLVWRNDPVQSLDWKYLLGTSEQPPTPLENTWYFTLRTFIFFNGMLLIQTLQKSICNKSCAFHGILQSWCRDTFLIWSHHGLWITFVISGN